MRFPLPISATVCYLSLPLPLLRVHRDSPRRARTGSDLGTGYSDQQATCKATGSFSARTRCCQMSRPSDEPDSTCSTKRNTWGC